VKHPVELVADVAVQLRADKTIFRRKHVMIIRITRTGCIEKSKAALCTHFQHPKTITSSFIVKTRRSFYTGFSHNGKTFDFHGLYSRTP
jgi:hypothetical protein